MEAFTLVLVIIIFILVLLLNSFIRKNLKKNEFEVDRLQKTVDEIRRKINGIKTLELKAKVELSKPLMAKAKTEEKIYSDIIPEPSKENQVAKENIKEEPQAVRVQKAASEEKIIKPEAIKQKIEKEKISFFEKYPDLEKFIGENLINKIGIVILVLGIGFLVKYAIDKNWINEIGRVAIGIISAGGLIGLAHKLRRDYKSFSSVLIGGGLALLYFTITLAFQTEGYPLYQQQTAAFIILVFITMFAVFLSIAYNRIEIAILAILGGFGSPLMLSNGSSNYVILFIYMMLLNAGMLVLSYYKKWRLVNIVSFIFTVLLFGSWLGSELLNNKYEAFGGAIFFATGFYVIFFLMNIIYNFKNKIDFKVGDISLILSNTFIYFTFVMLMLSHINEGVYKGLFSVLLGVFNFGFAYFTYTRQKTDANLLYLLIGLVFTFVTLAIPLQLKGNYITLFWSVESVLLLWLGQKSGFKIMKLGSILVALLMVISIVMDWTNNYDIIGFSSIDYVKQFAIIWNKMFITTLVSGFSFIATLMLLKREEKTIVWKITKTSYTAIVFIAAILVFYIGGFLEINYQAYHYFIDNSSQAVVAYTFNALFVLALLFLANKMNERKLSISISILSTFFVFAFLSALSSVFSKNAMVIVNHSEVLSTLLVVFRWMSVLSFYIISLQLFKLVNNVNNHLRNNLFKINTVFFIFILLFVLSSDLDTIAILISKGRDVLAHTQKTGYAILWALSSFVLMIIGMRRKEQIIRVLSLVLFAITIAKLFIYDISNISEGGKIVAFILLGVLLLIISFMYQKVKKLVVDDNVEDTTSESKSEIKE